MLWLIAIIAIFSTCQCENPQVSSPRGQYQGSLLKNSFGKTIFAFRGIRYAEAPIKELRFKPPVPAKKHEGVYNATEDAPACPQPEIGPTNEDCLFLNVYSTKLPEGNENPKRPVIVFIHQGDFYQYTGRSDWLGPQYLLNKDIVLVTFNYRLGTLGFLSTGDKEAPGNNGLKDQVEALKWTKENIESFGGDPNNITLAGNGAGGHSVSLHLVSPLSKGLFHKAIISSSSGFGQYTVERNQLDLAKRQAKAVGCPDDTSVNIVKCLRGKPANELAKSVNKLFEFGSDPILLWKPVIEDVGGQERFLTDHPVKLVLQGKFQEVPILSGITSDQFGDSALAITRNSERLRQLDEEWQKLAPIVLLYEGNPQSNEISKQLRAFYLGDKKLDNSTLVPLTNLYNDARGGFAVDRGVKLISAKLPQSVYYYLFSYKGQYSFQRPPGNNPSVGPVIYDDLIYLFYIPKISPEIDVHHSHFKIVDKSTTLWSNFVTYGRPIIRLCGKFNYEPWHPYNHTSLYYFDINDVVALRKGLRADRYAEWEKLFPL
ncbi:hypothetical protein WA026_001693 [Henosepilachna vigintioctopunctata]|uniref:Carboxylesterase type B domain-containing protein n=1 Tax=Henosepilachna vigintioctopunctata TaxID=420089 RepID=A0AAW1UU46_9CUCU